MTKSVVGVDVSKGKLDVAVSDEKRVRTWTNDASGCAELGEWVVVKNGGTCPQINGLKSPLFTSVNVR